MKSLLVNSDDHIEVKAYFVIQEMGGLQQKIYMIEDPSKTLLDGNIIFYIAYFRYPNYDLYHTIIDKSTKIDVTSNMVYINPKEVEKWIINLLLYAIVDMNGERIDITNENRVSILTQIDPSVLDGIYLEFRKKCCIHFR